MKLNKYLGFVLSLMGLIKTNYSPYSYHVHAYNKYPRIETLFTKFGGSPIDPYMPRPLIINYDEI